MIFESSGPKYTPNAFHWGWHGFCQRIVEDFLEEEYRRELRDRRDPEPHSSLMGYSSR